MADARGTRAARRRQHLRTRTSTKKRHDDIKRTVNSLQDSIDSLRLSIKYLMFDLEATRRENEYLRKMLEQDPNGGGGNGSGGGGNAE
ncbi:MAG: hypothetical protein CHACPFDD_04016 [Phycisphaerae bacterium]|nr:hypothetical protein [Phycisphaerae bacterium]